jgi:hypothetical protein
MAVAVVGGGMTPKFEIESQHFDAQLSRLSHPPSHTSHTTMDPRQGEQKRPYESQDFVAVILVGKGEKWVRAARG